MEKAYNEIISYCGLYCRLCSENALIPKTAEKLREYLELSAYKDKERGNETFSAFWEYLNKLSDKTKIKACKKNNCAPDVCGIRKCARRKNIEFCFECKEFPCEKILMLHKSTPTLLHDAERIKTIGLDKWVEEQEERLKKGFSYYHIHCQCDQFPLDFT